MAFSGSQEACDIQSQNKMNQTKHICEWMKITTTDGFYRCYYKTVCVCVCVCVCVYMCVCVNDSASVTICEHVLQFSYNSNPTN